MSLVVTGGFLTAFTHLAGVRRTLDARHAQQGTAERPEQDPVDIAVTRLLGATLVSAAAAAVLAVGTSVATDDQGRVTGVFAAATWAGSALPLVFSSLPCRRCTAPMCR